MVEWLSLESDIFLEMSKWLDTFVVCPLLQVSEGTAAVTTKLQASPPYRDEPLR